MTHAWAERFVCAWQRANSPREVGKELGILPASASRIAVDFRKLGVALKKFKGIGGPRADLARLRELARELRGEKR